MITIGIDTGMQGGIALLSDNTMLMHSMPLTMVDKKDRVDAYGVLNILNKHIFAFQSINMVLIENSEGGIVRGISTPTSAYQQGNAAGKVEAVLEILDLPRKLIRANVWKAKMEIVMPKGSSPKDRKACAIAKADSLMPQYKHLWRGPQGGPKDGLAEAALLAYLARRI